MALPKIDAPIFTTKLISSGKEVKFRPFTVKEEKLFLMAHQSEDTTAVTDTILQILNNCVLSDLDVKKLPIFDIEYLFLNLRARSIGEVVGLNYRCNNTVKNEAGEEKHCNNQVTIDVNLLEIQPEISEKHSNKIELNPNLGLVMKYPTLEIIDQFKDADEIDTVIDMIISCIDYIYDEDNIYYSKDSSEEELIEFMDSLPSSDLERIKEFFDTLPKLRKTMEFKCNKCGYQEDIELEGLQSFFA